MTFDERAEAMCDAISALLRVTPDLDLAKQIKGVVSQSLVAAVLDERTRCASVAVRCCDADADLAHKVAEGIQRQTEALQANLSALR